MKCNEWTYGMNEEETQMNFSSTKNEASFVDSLNLSRHRFPETQSVSQLELNSEPLDLHLSQASLSGTNSQSGSFIGSGSQEEIHNYQELQSDDEFY